ncbi:4'-phosphopantetheinyl transferase family protein [Paenibacillus sinensis]
MLHITEGKRRRIGERWDSLEAKRGIIADLLPGFGLRKSFAMERSEQLLFGTTPFGKPILLNKEHMHFNVSHSGEWVVCAVDDQPIGIDVEYINLRKIEGHYKVARRFFTSREYDDLMTRQGLEKARYFYDLWTLKESYIKKDGRGLSIPLNSFWFRLEDGKIHFSGGERCEPNHFRQYQIGEHYKLAYCSAKDQHPECPTIITLNELVDEITASKGERR